MPELPRRFGYIAIVTLIALAACERRPASKAPEARAPAPAADVGAAAEPFERLTETAFSASGPELDATIGQAEAAASAIRPLVPANAVHELDRRLSEVRAARQVDDRTGVALAAVEGYRILVSSSSGPAVVPTDVSLLDYAGFRYQADLKAQPVRWEDITQAAVFARERWEAVKSQVADTALRARFEEAVSSMEVAARSRNASLADDAVKTELDLVDELETYFTARHSPAP